MLVSCTIIVPYVTRSYENGKPVPSSQPVPDLHYILLSCRLTCKVVALNIFANIQYLVCRMIGANDSKYMACRAIGKTKAYLSAQYIIIIKACRLLVSQGVAPNNESTWNLLVSKHPKGVCPVGLPGAPNDGTLPPNYNLLPVLRSFPKLTGAGPSGLRIQHLLDAVEVPLQTPILHSLKAVVNILSSGRAPALISPFLAGGNLTALVKSKDSCALDIRPIAVGETLRRLTAKCICAVVKAKAAKFSQPTSVWGFLLHGG